MSQKFIVYANHGFVVFAENDILTVMQQVGERKSGYRLCEAISIDRNNPINSTKEAIAICNTLAQEQAKHNNRVVEIGTAFKYDGEQWVVVSCTPNPDVWLAAPFSDMENDHSFTTREIVRLMPATFILKEVENA